MIITRLVWDCYEIITRLLRGCLRDYYEAAYETVTKLLRDNYEAATRTSLIAMMK